MAQLRRSPQHHPLSPSAHSPTTSRKKYLLRRPPPSRRRVTAVSSSSPSTSHAPHASPPHHRTVLAPLHPNLRRLPSRQVLAQKDNGMHLSNCNELQAGKKRKRVPTANENLGLSERSTRGRAKRLRGSMGQVHRYNTNEDDDDESTMEIDSWSSSNHSDTPEEDDDAEDEEGEAEDHGEDDSSNDFLLNTASLSQLQRLRKDELVRLYITTGLSDDPDRLTKLDLARAIMDVREDDDDDDDELEVPPSSPGHTDGNSSGYSSDEGNMGGDEETDFVDSRYPHAGISPLKRRATAHDITKHTSRHTKGRRLSLGNILPDPSLLVKKTDRRDSSSRRKTSNCSSPTPSTTPSAVSNSSPGKKLRPRKMSGATQLPTPISANSSSGLPLKGQKGRAKQVEFSQEVNKIKPSVKSSPRDRNRAAVEPSRGADSDLTELEELEESLNAARCYPSPRRLRSKPSKEHHVENQTPTKLKQKPNQALETDRARRSTPMRKAKAKIVSLKEDDEDEDEDVDAEEEEEEEEEEEADELEENDDEQEEGQEDGGDGDEQEEDEVDELVSSASVTPPPLEPRRTPIRGRLRPRGGHASTEQDVDEGDDGDVDGEGEGGDGCDDEEPTAVEPRKLRNGKVVGEEDIEMEIDEEDDIDDEDEEDEDEDGNEGEEEEEADDNEDADEVVEEDDEESAEVEEDLEATSEEDEIMDEEVDLTVATAKTLIRLRRDDLVRLCETRDLEPVGTKPQLAEALLQWRDRHVNGFSSPSSAGTVRPPSTAKRNRKRTTRNSQESNSSTATQKQHDLRTPPPSFRVKEIEPELELDLESLGLEDREIPPDKLQKLEKIGSGGFKDVFVGKFKGRKIAISEFRGQLSAMDIKELKLLGGFDHPNIVRFLGVSIPENTRETPVMIVSELCANGDLFDYIRNTNAPTLHKVLQIMSDIARGLDYLHSRKPSIIHRDCKSSNILITTKGTAKIADFGLAKVKQSTRSMVRSLVGTVNWQAPELWHAHPKYNHKVDVFSCAMVFWEMLQWHQITKKFPWEGMNEHAIYDIVGAKRQRPSVSGLRKQWCPEIVDLIEHMWAHEHQDRPTMDEVVATLEHLVKQY